MEKIKNYLEKLQAFYKLYSLNLTQGTEILIIQIIDKGNLIFDSIEKGKTFNESKIIEPLLFIFKKVNTILAILKLTFAKNDLIGILQSLEEHISEFIIANYKYDFEIEEDDED